MRGSIIGITIGLGQLLGCAPDLAANEAMRCQESLECLGNAVCYRGFCVPEGTLTDAGSTPVDIADSSPSGAAQPEHDAGITASNEVADAGSATSTSQPGAAVPPQPGPSAPDPAAMQPTPPPQTPMQMGPQTAPDAGPVVVDLPGSCTLADCCAEARRSLQGVEAEEPMPGPMGKGDDDDETEPKAKKAKVCGCADPGLLSGLLCGVLGPLGVLP